MTLLVTLVVVLAVCAAVTAYFLVPRPRRRGERVGRPEACGSSRSSTEDGSTGAHTEPVSSADPSSAGTDTDLPPGVVSDERARTGLPPGSGTRGEGEISGVTRDAAPYDDTPATGKFAPGADNPPPGAD